MPVSKNIRITLDMLQSVRRRSRRAGYNHPCSKYIQRVLDGLEATNHNVGPIYRQVKDMEDCVAYYKYMQKKTQDKDSTLYYLSQYLDRQKHKRK